MTSPPPTPAAPPSGEATTVHLSPVARLLRWLVRGYQHLASGRPSPCRYVPTCSMYALDALEQHGAVRGSWLAARRLGRCHPWSRHSGWDPVPPAGSGGS